MRTGAESRTYEGRIGPMEEAILNVTLRAMVSEFRDDRRIRRMIWAWLIAGILVAGMLLFVFSDIKLRVRFSRVGGDDQITVDVKALYGLLRPRYSVPMLNWNENGLQVKTESAGATNRQKTNNQKLTITRDWVEAFFDRARAMLAYTVKLTEWGKNVMARVRCTEVRWDTQVGLGDAADTAITTGIVWGLKTSLLGYLFRHVRLKTKPLLHVQPQFNRMQFETKAVFQFKIKTVFAVYAGFLLVHRILRVKGGFRYWRKLLFKPS